MIPNSDVRVQILSSNLGPFIEVIVSPYGNGVLTSAALSSLTKFIMYGFLSIEHPHVDKGINLIANCLSHCVFEESDRESDEVILLKVRNPFRIHFILMLKITIIFYVVIGAIIFVIANGSFPLSDSASDMASLPYLCFPSSSISSFQDHAIRSRGILTTPHTDPI